VAGRWCEGDAVTTPAELIDHHDIVAIAIRYAWALDTNDWEALDAVFAEDATVDFMGSKHEGRAAIKDRISGALGRMDDSQHIVSNHEVVLDGDRARHRCYLQAQHIRADVEGGKLFIIAGRYEDDMVRTADGWRIQHRSLIRMWSDGNPEVVRR